MSETTVEQIAAHGGHSFRSGAAFICSFSNGLFRAVSPNGGQSVLFEDSDRFGPSKISPRDADIIGDIPERLRWFWDWYPRWREAGRPYDREDSSPIGAIRTVRAHLLGEQS